MNKFKSAVKVVTKFVDDNLPTILSGLALLGLGASVYSAAKDAPKALREVREEECKKLFSASDEELAAIGAERVEEIPDDYDGYYVRHSENRGSEEIIPEEIILYRQKHILTFGERALIYGRVFWKTTVLTVLTGACIVTSNLVSKRRYLALATLVATRTKELDEYKEKAKELFGEKKTEQIEKEIIKDKGLECPSDIENRYQPGMAYPLEFCGHYWLGTKHEVEQAFDRWNRGGLDEAMKTVDGEVELYLEDLIYEMKLNIPDTWVFRHTSWNVKNGSVDPVFEPWETPNGTPGYSVRPSRNADNYG